MKELYYYLIGLIEPWTVDDVPFQVKSQQVDIWVSYKSNCCQCCECKESCPIYDHVNERNWRHLDMGKLFLEFDEKGTTRTCCKCNAVVEGGLSPKIRVWQCFEIYGTP